MYRELKLPLVKMYLKAFFLIVTGSFLFLSAASQKSGSDTSLPKKKRFFNNIFQQVRNAVYVNKTDSVIKASVLNTKSETPYLRYQGKVIRHVKVEQLGFERTFADTSNRIKYFGTRILNAMHIDTKAWVIRDNLFIKENAPLNAYEVADNERYLRTLEFIQDARILVKPIAGIQDSIDLVVVTKDLFSITGGIDVNGLNRVRGKVAETNLFGMAQKVQFSALVDRKRQPNVGYEFVYSKNSIANSFVNASLGYTLINTGISDGWENERAEYIRLDRPLLSPFSHLAGSFEMSRNTSENVYNKPDSFFFKYRYNIFDLWAGYNLGYNYLLSKQNTRRSRSFLAFRFLNKKFTLKPEQVHDVYHPTYNDRKALLTEFTIFKQDFYKTNYIYGFGTTEDLPYGYNIAFTAGWTKQITLERPYFGINANQFVATTRGEFMQYFFRSGIFLSKGNIQDACVLAGGNFYSKLYVYKKMKIRQNIRFSYSKLINRVASDPLRIDNPLGLQYFRSDSILGNQRLSLYAETFIFTGYKLFGFQMAPFFYADLSVMTPEHKQLFSSDMYSGIGGGLRTRNENLVFGTIELRFHYFPRPADRMNHFAVSFRSNIRFRFNNRYVKAPDLIQMNSDDAIRTY
jgi:hypothetical protein